MKKNYINVFLYSLILFSLYCSLTIGLSWDELAVVEISKLRLKYLFSLGAVDYKSLWFSKFYPGTYGVTAMFFSQLFPKSYETDILHICNSLIGISTIFGISKIAKELFNKKIGYIVFVISFFNPIFFGHMAMNERDLVIAFCNIWMTYSLLKYFKYNYIKKKRNNIVIILGLLLGLGLSCRISFIITLLPIFVFLTIDSLFIKKICKEKLLIKRFIKDILISVFIGYFILIIFWPEVYPNIFVLPFQFFNETLNFGWGVPQGLINGVFYETSHPPKNYLLSFLFHKLPEYFILNYLLFFVILIKSSSFFKKKFNNFNYKIILVILIIIFPNLLLLISPYPIYDNIRLFLYLLPYLSIIPGIVIYYLIENLKLKLNKILTVFVSILFIYSVYTFFSLTPYQYTYLNIFSGKFSESHKKFESDYWGTSIKELLTKTNFENNNQINLAICGIGKGNVKYYLKKLNIRNVKIVSFDENYDYIIMTNRVFWNSNVKNLKDLNTCFDQFSGNTISSVKRRGLTLSLIRSNII